MSLNELLREGVIDGNFVDNIVDNLIDNIEGSSRFEFDIPHFSSSNKEEFINIFM